MILKRCIVVSLLASSLGACSNDRDIAGPSSPRRLSGAQYELVAAANGRFERGAEDEILRMEGFLPGLGGIYLKGDTLVVYVPPTTSRAQALSALATAAVTSSVDPDMRGRMVRGERIKFINGAYPFSALVAWSKEIVRDVFHVSGVTGIDADEGTNRLTILVTDLAATPGVFAVTRSHGIPDGAITIRKVGNLRSSSGVRDNWRPTGGGIQIDNGVGNGKCTLGYNATMGPDNFGFYTAGHCSGGKLGFGQTGGVIYQAVSGSTTRLGTVTINPAWNLTAPECEGVVLCTEVDAMYVRYDTASTWSSRVATLSGLSNYGSGHLIVGSVSSWWTNVSLTGTTYWEGIQVDKVGRTTGWSRGTLSSTCQTRTTDPFGNSYRVICADEVTGAYVGGGDSGAPVFVAHDNSNTQLNALGILFAYECINGENIEDGDTYCTSSESHYLYSRMSRIFMYLVQPY